MTKQDENTGLIGLVIGAGVMGLIASKTPISRESLIEEIRRLGRQKGDGVEDDVFLRAAQLVEKGC
jgi:hypothetical protein